MGFFATFWSWLNAQLGAYVGDNTARLANLLEPVVVTLGVIYVMGWGCLQLTGKIDEPVLAGLKRIGLLALVFGAGLRLWLYNAVIVDTFYSAPAQLGAAMVGASDPVGAIDAIWSSGGDVADQLLHKASLLSGGLTFAMVGLVVWLLVGTLCVYAMFLIALSSVALSLLLALGPLFIAMLLFDATKRLFVAWIAQLANYGLITILTIMLGALLLKIVESYAAQTAALGNTIRLVDATNMVLVAVLVLLVLRQVMPIAAALAGGVSLSSHGTMSGALFWAMRANANARQRKREEKNTELLEKAVGYFGSRGAPSPSAFLAAAERAYGRSHGRTADRSVGSDGEDA
jgi:type IV secretion system protein VirB6